MGHRLSEHSQSVLVYDLSAFLIHKGSAINSGHYMAHIKDENTGQWREFDDGQVSNLGRHPSSTAKSVQTEPVVHGSCSEPMDVVATGNLVDASQPKSSESNAFNPMPTFSSSDVYMLMYIPRHLKSGSKKAQMVSGGINMENASGSLTTSPANASMEKSQFQRLAT